MSPAGKAVKEVAKALGVLIALAGTMLALGYYVDPLAASVFSLGFIAWLAWGNYREGGKYALAAILVPTAALMGVIELAGVFGYADVAAAVVILGCLAVLAWVAHRNAKAEKAEAAAIAEAEALTAEMDAIQSEMARYPTMTDEEKFALSVRLEALNRRLTT